MGARGTPTHVGYTPLHYVKWHGSCLGNDRAMRHNTPARRAAHYVQSPARPVPGCVMSRGTLLARGAPGGLCQARPALCGIRTGQWYRCGSGARRVGERSGRYAQHFTFCTRWEILRLWVACAPRAAREGCRATRAKALLCRRQFRVSTTATDCKVLRPARLVFSVA